MMYLPIRSKDTRDKIDLLKTRLRKNTANYKSTSVTDLAGASGSEGDVTVAGTKRSNKAYDALSLCNPDYVNTMQDENCGRKKYTPLHSTDYRSASVIINGRLQLKDLAGRISFGKAI